MFGRKRELTDEEMEELLDSFSERLSEKINETLKMAYDAQLNPERGEKVINFINKMSKLSTSV